MDRINMNVEMTLTLDKKVYTSPDFEWCLSDKNRNVQTVKTAETFFDYHIIEPIDQDYPIMKREADRTPENIEAYKPLLEVMKNITSDIRKSIKYTIVSEKDNIEVVQVNFNFGYYQQSRSPENLFNTLVLVAGVNRYKGNVKIVRNEVVRQQSHNKEINMQIINEKLKQWEYVISVFDNMKFTILPDIDKTVEIESTKKLKK